MYFGFYFSQKVRSVENKQFDDFSSLVKNYGHLTLLSNTNLKEKKINTEVQNNNAVFQLSSS